MSVLQALKIAPGMSPATSTSALCLFLCLCFLSGFFLPGFSLAADTAVPGQTGLTDSAVTQSVHRESAHSHPAPLPARTVRVLYWEGGPHEDHQLILRGLAEVLHSKGCLTSAQLPEPVTSSARAMWEWLSDHAADSIVFVRDAFYSCDWSGDRRKNVLKAVETRVAEGDIDLVLGFDTWTAQDALQSSLTIPVLVSSITSLKGTNLEAALAGSADKQVFLVHEQGHLERLTGFFHSLFGFAKAGCVQDISPAGQAMAGLAGLEQAAQRHGFALMRCEADLWSREPGILEERLLACHRELVHKGVEAVFLSISSEPASHMDVQKVLAPLRQAGIPVLSLAGGREVRAGALLGPGKSPRLETGRLLARLLLDYSRGMLPDRRNISFPHALTLSLNMSAAQKAGWEPPVRVLAITEDYVDANGNWHVNGTRP